MPLTFLIDAGSVTSTPILDNGFSIQDGIVQAMCFMLESLKNTASYQPIEIRRLGGGKEIQRTTSDFDLAISSLKSIQIAENEASDAFIGLNDTIESNHRTFGLHLTHQIVIIGFLGNPISEALSTLTLPPHWTTHWILFHKVCLNQELSEYQRLPCTKGSKIEFLNLETFDLFPRLQSIVTRITAPLNANLTLGHIQMEILSISGFLPDRIAFLPPSLQRYVIIPHDSTPQSTDSSNTTGNASRSEDSSVAALLLLCHSIYESERVAVVNLCPNWFGLLSAQKHRCFVPSAISQDVQGQLEPGISIVSSSKPENDEKLQMILTVLDIDSELPFTGPIDSMVIEANEKPGTLTVRSEEKKDTAMETDSTIFVSPMPNLQDITQDCPSYHITEETTADGWSLYGDAASVALEFSRFHAMLFELPYQRVPLFQQAERIRNMSMLYSLPHVMEQLTQLVLREIPPSKNQTMKSTIIKHLMESIAFEAFPIQWEDEWENEIERTRLKRRKARHTN